MKLSDWLEQYGSHDVYDAAILDDCPIADAREIVPTQTPRQVAAAMRDRGLGGWMDPDAAAVLVTGYVMAEALGAKALGAPGSWTRYQGRGSRFRAVIRDLREAGL